MRDFPEGINVVTQAGYPVIRLPSRPAEPDYEKVFAEIAPEAIVFDTLGSSVDLMAAARRWSSKIVTLDDLEPSAGEADAIINGILWATRMMPQTFGRAKVYQGVEYIPLRDEFVALHARTKPVPESGGRVLISTGGSDIRGMTVGILTEFYERGVRDISITAVIGAAHSDPDSVYAAAARWGSDRCTVVQNAAHMGELLFESDLAIITGGTVLFESAACGVPAVVCSSHDHQAPAARWFTDHGAAVYLGDFAEALGTLPHVVATLLKDGAQRRRMCAAGHSLVDGKGLERTGKVILTEILGGDT
jgi:spore coat polysaccharide biosynthesis predicted glycosyltransferase SpsG